MVILCVIGLSIEIRYSIISNSLALLTDTVELAKDSAVFSFNIICIHYSKMKSSERNTFGYLKTESIGAFVSVVLIWMFYIFLIFESINVIRKGGRNVN